MVGHSEAIGPRRRAIPDDDPRQALTESIRKLNRTRKDQVPDNAPLDAQPEEVPF